MNRNHYASVRRIAITQEVEIVELAPDFMGAKMIGPYFVFPIWYGPNTREPEIGERVATREHDGVRYVVAPAIASETTTPVKVPCPKCGHEISITVVTRGSGGGPGI